MTDIRKWKGLLGLTLALVLLSFFYASPVQIRLEQGGAAQEVNSAAVLTAEHKGLPDGSARISLARTLMDDIAAKEQKAERTLPLRVLAVVAVLTFLIRAISRIVIRRYGYHMIALWQNIYYIHEVDGEKGNRFQVYIGYRS